MEVAETMSVKVRERDIEKQVAENRELVATAAAESASRRAAAAHARERLRRAQMLIRRATGHAA